MNKKTIAGWCIYDFAHSAFSTLVITFIYSAYFTQNIAADPISGTELWSWTMSASALIIGIISPVLAAYADRYNLRKTLLMLCTYMGALATGLLFNVQSGQIYQAMLIVALANIAMELAAVFYNAYLKDISTAQNIGRISGTAWGLGYFGGLLALYLALQSMVADDAWLGISQQNGLHIRSTMLLTSLWIILFCLPTFLFVPRQKVRQHSISALQLLRQTLHQLKGYPNILRFLLARLVYNDGLITVFSFGGVYAAGTFGFSFSEILSFGIVINLASGVGAIMAGFIDDKLGGKRTIQLSLAGLIIATLIIATTHSKMLFWLCGILIGICAGPNQSASRSFMARMIPQEKSDEFFGFFAFSGKVTVFIGPLLFGLATKLFHTQRAGVAVIVGLLIIGSYLLSYVTNPND